MQKEYSHTKKTHKQITHLMRPFKPFNDTFYNEFLFNFTYSYSVGTLHVHSMDKYNGFTYYNAFFADA